MGGRICFAEMCEYFPIPQRRDMKTEYEKCMPGERYDCRDEVFVKMKGRERDLLAKYNFPLYGDMRRGIKR